MLFDLNNENKVYLMEENTKIDKIIIYAPIIVIVVCSLLSILFTLLLGVYAYIPVLLIYWGILALFIILKKNTKNMIKRWLQPSKGNILWSILPFFFAIMTIPMLIINWHFLANLEILIPLIIFTAINPFMEEFFWRGLLLDVFDKWPIWSKVLYSSVLFTMNHPLVIGIFSIANRMVIFLFTTLILSTIFAIVYIKTSTLRWLILAHMLMDFLGISIVVFLNYYIPEGIALW
jgi:membrane protease YdiL (CAAX protease family)